MNLITNKKIFYVNSRNRISGSDNNFSYKLDLNASDEFDSVVVLACSIPKSYYLIRPGKNTFLLLENNGTTSNIVTLPIGNYSRKTFQTVLQSALNSASLNGYIYTVSYPNLINQADNGKFNFIVSNNGLDQPIFSFSTNVYYALGFDPNTSYTFSANQLISKNVINLQLEPTLFLHSDICQNEEGDNVLCDIYSADGSVNYSNIKYEMIDLESNTKPLTNSGQNIFNFYLQDEDGNDIDLNGINLNITLMCYKKNTLTKKLFSFLDLLTIKL